MSALLEVTDLRAGFRGLHGVTRAVDGVSFALAPGETLGIVGESGSGKSALAAALMRLMPPGGVVLGGTARFTVPGAAAIDLLAARERELRALRGRRIAMIFQDPLASLNPFLRLGPQVAEPLRRHLGLGAAAARTRAIELLASVGIPEPAERYARWPHEFSGGQRQRAMIATALSCDPDLIIADEPTTALDVTVQAQVLALMKAEQRRRGMAMIFISHNLAVVAAVCDRALVMYAGRVVEAAAVRDLVLAPRHPYTRALVAALPRLDGARGGALAAIPGQPPPDAGAAWAAGCAFAPRCPRAVERCLGTAPLLLADTRGRLHRCRVEQDEAAAAGAARG